MATEDTIREYYDAILQIENPDQGILDELAGQVDGGVVTLNEVRDELITSAQDDVYAVVRMYQAAFGRVPDNAALDGGLDYWSDQLREGNLSLSDLARAFTASDEFADRYGDIDHITEGYVTELYQNVLGRQPDQAGLDYWTAQDQLSAAQMLVAFSESDEFKERSDDAIHDFLDRAAQSTEDYEGTLFSDGGDDDGVSEDDDDDGGGAGTNQAPVIGFDSGDADRTIQENQTDVADVDANDPDGDSVTFTIAGGDDASLFTIDASSGDLEFKDAPDFESPQDADTDNTYEVTIKASDGALNDSRDVSVTVTNVDGNTLIATGPDFDTTSGATIQDELKATNEDDTIKVSSNSYLNSSVLDGGGGVDTVQFSGNTATDPYDLRILSRIDGFQDDVSDTLELNGATTSLFGDEDALNSFANIDGNGGDLFAAGAVVDLIGNANADKTTLSDFGSIFFTGNSQNIKLNGAEIPTDAINFNDPYGSFADTLSISAENGGGHVIDFTLGNIALTDLGAGDSSGRIDTIALPTIGTLVIDGSQEGNFENFDHHIALSAGGMDSQYAIASEGDLDLGDFASVTNFGALKSTGTGIAIANDNIGREIVGDDGANTITSGSGGDTIDGGGGGDTITGGGGTNHYTASAGADTYTGTADENATLTYNDAAYSQYGGDVDTIALAADRPASINVNFVGDDFVSNPGTTETDIYRSGTAPTADTESDFFKPTSDDMAVNGEPSLNDEEHYGFVLFEDDDSDVFNIYFDANGDGNLSSDDMQIRMTGISDINDFPDVGLETPAA